MSIVNKIDDKVKKNKNIWDTNFQSKKFNYINKDEKGVPEQNV